MNNNYIFLTAGIILTLTGFLNLVFHEKIANRKNKRGEMPSPQMLRINKFLCAITFFVGLFFTLSTIVSMNK